MRLELIATATFGLEAVVKREIEQLGYRILKTEDGKVTYMGDERAIVRSNLWLRSADRVLLKMAEFEAREFEELFQRTKALDWEQLVPLDGKFTVTGTSVKSRLHSVPACQKIVKKAIVEKLKEFYDVETFPETGAQYTVKVTILKDRVTLTIDTSGAGLHKRGYRQADVAAPGLNRSFACEEWELIEKDIWREEKKAAFQAIDYNAELEIYGYDINGRAVRAAMENAQEAGVDDCIAFRRQDVAKLEPTGENGIIIVNPPYGERIGEEAQIKEIYKALGGFLKDYPDWSLFMITTDKEAEERVAGRKADRRRKLYNGRLETCYYQFHGQRRTLEGR